MSAIEYGSYYWCVVLNGSNGHEPGTSGELIYLHADEMAVDPTGSLTFTSAGRRPAGTEPQQDDQKENGKSGGSGGEKGEKKSSEKIGMIYVAFAPGTWKVAYAAKLQDGSPASVEHWNGADGRAADGGGAGARGYIPTKS
jgi:hypothetical protein